MGVRLAGNPNSPGWQSPEMLAGQPYGKAADVFSFGVVLWEVMTRKEPWRCCLAAKSPTGSLHSSSCW